MELEWRVCAAIWREIMQTCIMSKVWLASCQNSAKSCVLSLYSSLATLLIMFKSKTCTNLTIRSHIIENKIWLRWKLQFQGTLFATMVLITQGPLWYNLGLFRKLRLQTLQCTLKGSIWQLELKFMIIWNHQKHTDFFTLRKISNFGKKWLIMFLIQTWPSIQNLLLSFKDEMN